MDKSKPKYIIDHDGQRIPYAYRPIKDLNIPDGISDNEQITAIREHLEYIVGRGKEIRELNKVGYTFDKNGDVVMNDDPDYNELLGKKKSLIDKVPDAVLGAVGIGGLTGIGIGVAKLAKKIFGKKED